MFIWNPSKCESECDKSCDLGQYFDYENCKYKKKQTDKPIEECSEDIGGNEMIYNVTSNDHEKVCSSCTIYIALLVIAFLIIIGIRHFYFHWYFRRGNTNTITNAYTNNGTAVCYTYKREVLKK